MSQKKILVLPGDGIGPEIIDVAVKVLKAVIERFDLPLELSYGLIGGASIDKYGEPLTETVLEQAHDADAILLGAVGGPAWDDMPMSKRPEKALLKLRQSLGLFANLRPIRVFPELVDASTLKPELVSGLDFLIVRELTGGLYFGEPRGVRILDNGEREGFNTYVYRESEIKQIATLAFDLAKIRNGRVCSVDKANVLEVTRLWREVVDEVGQDYKDVELSHMYVDNAAMQLVRSPKQFDVMLTGNMFGDILSDCAAMLTGSIGMLPSASLNADKKGMYEPIHGSAPDIAGQDVANPLATILSVGEMMRYSFAYESAATSIELAVQSVLQQGLRTKDIAGPLELDACIGPQAMGDEVLAHILR